MKNGVDTNSGSLGTSLVNMASNAVKSLTSFLQIRSPSHLLADEVGKYIPSGVALGVDRNMDVLTDSMQSLKNVTVDSLSDISVSGTSYRSDNASYMAQAMYHSVGSAMQNAMSKLGNNGSNGDNKVTVVLELDGEVMARGVMKGQTNIDTRVRPVMVY